MIIDHCATCRNAALPGKLMCASCGWGYEGRTNYVPMHTATWAGSTGGHELHTPLSRGASLARIGVKWLGEPWRGKDA